jgi:uncharacterized protein YkwD
MYTSRAPMMGQDTTTIDLTASGGASGTTTYYGPSDTSSTTDTSATPTDTTTAVAATPPAPAASTSDTGGFLTSLFSGIAQVAGAAAPIVQAVSAGNLTTAQQVQFAALNAQRASQGLSPLSAQQYLQTVAPPTVGARLTAAVKSAPASTLLLGGLAAVGLVVMLARK